RQTPTKSANISSAIARLPASAAPAAAPTMQDSEIGVSITRFAPNAPYRPPVIPQIPPMASGPPAVPLPPTISSPSMIRFGSCSISARIVRDRASRIVNFAMLATSLLVRDVDVLDHVRGVRSGRLARFLHRCIDQGQHLGVDRRQRARIEQILLQSLVAKQFQA